MMIAESRAKTKNSIAELAREMSGDPYALMQLLLALSKKTTLNRIIRFAEYPVVVPPADLKGRLRLMEECMLENKDNIARIFALLYEKCIREEERKKEGQYFTPEGM